MTNSKKLNECIKRSGYRIYYLASCLNLSYQAFKKKVDGETEFKASEISRLSELLKLTAVERDQIFFAVNVDN